MNPPLTVSLNLLSLTHRMALTTALQVGCRVRWWDNRGQLKYGRVKAINILSDVGCMTDLLPDPDFLCFFFFAIRPLKSL